MSKSNSSERGDKKRNNSSEQVLVGPEARGVDRDGDADWDGNGGRDPLHWKIVQQRLREQADLFEAAESVRETVEVMLQTEVEEGTRDEDKPMSPAELDKRKQRIKDWLGHLVRLQLAEESVALAKAKFELTKSKVDGGTVQVAPEMLLDHQALVNWLQKRPELFDEFQRERDELEA